MLYMVTFAINIPPMLAYIPYMDPMGKEMGLEMTCCSRRTERNGFKMREGNQTGSDLDWQKLGFSQKLTL